MRVGKRLKPESIPSLQLPKSSVKGKVIDEQLQLERINRRMQRDFRRQPLSAIDANIPKVPALVNNLIQTDSSETKGETNLSNNDAAKRCIVQMEIGETEGEINPSTNAAAKRCFMQMESGETKGENLSTNDAANRIFLQMDSGETEGENLSTNDAAKRSFLQIESGETESENEVITKTYNTVALKSAIIDNDEDTAVYLLKQNVLGLTVDMMNFEKLPMSKLIDLLKKRMLNRPDPETEILLNIVEKRVVSEKVDEEVQVDSSAGPNSSH